MELKRRISGKYVFAVLYCVAFAVYIWIGLQPAEAVNYEISSNLSIPAIDLQSDVTALSLNNQNLDTPDTIVGSFQKSPNKTLLIGHSTTVFKNLHEIHFGDLIYYNNKTYQINDINTLAKAKISMAEILEPAKSDTIVIMTCAGQLLDGGDATHRLIITAVVLED